MVHTTVAFQTPSYHPFSLIWPKINLNWPKSESLTLLGKLCLSLVEISIPELGNFVVDASAFKPVNVGSRGEGPSERELELEQLTSLVLFEDG